MKAVFILKIGMHTLTLETENIGKINLIRPKGTNNMSIQSILSNLSEHERGLHAELIKECLMRESELNNAVESNKNAVVVLSNFCSNLQQLFDVISVLNSEVTKYYEQSTPDENYYEGL
jgi:hypothetical protein